MKNEEQRKQSAEAAAADRRQERIAELDARVIRGMARGREANIEVGRALRELKRILRHGKWQRHFAETFAPCGLTLRTAENYMRLAREADSQIEKTSIFKPATDPGAQKMRAATARAEAEVAGATRHKAKKEHVRLKGRGPYRLLLHMTADEMGATDALQKLPAWPRAEQKIITLLRQFFVECGIVQGDRREDSAVDA